MLNFFFFYFRLDDHIQDLDIQNFETLKQEYLKVVQRCQKLEQEKKQNLKAYIKDTSRLKKKVKRLQSERHFEEKCVQRLKHIFTGKQVDKLLHPHKKKLMWDMETIAGCISFRSISPKGYRYLYNKGYPLPSMSTLK